MSEECGHTNFRVDCAVNRLEDSGDFQLDVRVRCTGCGTNFKFLGLPQGLNLDGASTSFDCEEARLAISPDGLRSYAKGVRGFSIKGPDQ